MSLKASISGIRGIVGESLTPQILSDYLSAFSKILPKGAILIGRDSRVTGEMILKLTKSIMNFCGRDVVDIGIIPTPVVLFGVNRGDYAGGIIITASHNPVEWNALKFVNDRGKFLSPKEFESLSSYYNNKDFEYCRYDEIGDSSHDKTVIKNHIDTVVNAVDYKKIESKKIKVALDTVNGAGGEHTITLLERFGCEVISINTEPTGYFSHPPEPTPKNLTQLSELIKKEGADIGFALDPDGDRLVLADNKGNILSEELTLALSIKQFLKYHKKTDIVVNLSSSRINEDIANKFECDIYYEPTGEINVTEKMEQVGALIGGEGNGGVISLSINKCRDASVGIAYILEALALEDRPIDILADELPKYSLLKEKYQKIDINIEDIEKKLRNIYMGARIDNRDGIRIDFDKKWVLIRKSNTEPILRIFAEAQIESEAKTLIDTVAPICGV